MKKNSIISFIFLITILSTSACQKTNHTPMHASMSIKANMEHLNYEDFTDAYARGEEKCNEKSIYFCTMYQSVINIYRV